MTNAHKQLLDFNISNHSVANIFKAMQTANKTLSMWLQYIDDTFSLWPHETEELNWFQQHIKSIPPSIQFTLDVVRRQ